MTRVLSPSIVHIPTRAARHGAEQCRLHAANLLDGAAGADRVNGAAGDDVLVYDALDELLDGGTGDNSLRIAGSGITLDLRASDDARLLHIDPIDLSGSGDHRLLLNLSNVLARGAAGDSLRVSGDAGDSLTSLAHGWLADVGDAQLIDGVQYQAYSAGNAPLLVEFDVLHELVVTAPMTAAFAAVESPLRNNNRQINFVIHITAWGGKVRDGR